MWSMATGAAFGLHGHMLVDEWSLLVGVTLKTHRIPTGQRLDLAYGRSSVHVVAVVALHQPFVYAVMVGLGEIGLGCHVAAVAEIGLGSNQQVLRLLRLVRGVAVDAAHIVACMRRTGEVPLLAALTVARQATRAAILPGKILKADDLGFVPPAFNMLRAGAMTGFATVPIFERGLEVGSTLKTVLVEIFVAALAGIGADILGGRLGLWGVRLVLRRGRHRETVQNANATSQDKRDKKPMRTTRASWDGTAFLRTSHTPHSTSNRISPRPSSVSIPRLGGVSQCIKKGLPYAATMWLRMA